MRQTVNNHWRRQVELWFDINNTSTGKKIWGRKKIQFFYKNIFSITTETLESNTWELQYLLGKKNFSLGKDSFQTKKALLIILWEAKFLSQTYFFTYLGKQTFMIFKHNYQFGEGKFVKLKEHPFIIHKEAILWVWGRKVSQTQIVSI